MAKKKKLDNDEKDEARKLYKEYMEQHEEEIEAASRASAAEQELSDNFGIDVNNPPDWL